MDKNETFDARAAAQELDDEVNPPRRFDVWDFISEMLDCVGRVIDQLAEFFYIPTRHLVGHSKWRRSERALTDAGTRTVAQIEAFVQGNQPETS